jgi:23S rRNA (cytosine1962-C5)-methyltransferase
MSDVSGPSDRSSPAEGYELLDSGGGRKLERFGPHTLVRPCAQAVWKPRLPPAAWTSAHAAFDREGGLRWQGREALPEAWVIAVDGIRFRLSGTDFGHLGIFPEQRACWRWLQAVIERAPARRPLSVLNLFAYSGGATLFAARAGASVCHLDASKGMVAWARENAALNGLQSAPIRWIVDDVSKFLKRERRRGCRYDGIILDPPTFGRGRRGEVYKIEEEMPETLQLCRQLLSDAPRFVLLSCHTPGFTPMVLRNVLQQGLAGLAGDVECGEMLLTGAAGVCPVPSGVYARWPRKP